MDAEKLVEDLTGRVRDALAQAEERAKEIVAKAQDEARAVIADGEAEAARIRERAEAEADERLAKVREALSGLEGALGGGGKQPHASPASEVDPRPPPVPEPTPQPTPEPMPPAEPEPQPPAEPEPLPPEPEIEPPAPPQPDRPAPQGEPGPEVATVNGGAEKGDEIGARIVATKMALDGSARGEIAAHLAAKYEVEDAEKLLDFVMQRAKR